MCCMFSSFEDSCLKMALFLFYFEDLGAHSHCGRAEMKVFEDTDGDIFSNWMRPSHVTILLFNKQT